MNPELKKVRDLCVKIEIAKTLEHYKKIESPVKIAGISQNIDNLFEQHKLLSIGISEYIKIETTLNLLKHIQILQIKFFKNYFPWWNKVFISY